MRPLALALALTLTVPIVAPPLVAQSLTIETVNFQVQLRDGLGNPINGPTTVQTRVYDAASGGTPLWTEAHSTNATNGVVNLALGSLVPFPSNLFQGGSRYLGVQVATDPEMTPRLEIAAVPVALTSQKVQALEPAQVNTTAIAPSAVTSAKLADAAVSTAKLADAAVDGSKLADAAVSSAKLADLAVGSNKLADAAVTTTKLGDDAVSSAKLADDAVTTPKVCDTAITTSKLADAAVDAVKLGNDSVTTSKVCNTAITTSKLADAAVDTVKLGNDSVTTSKVCNTAITTSKLADAAVDAVKLGNDSVTTPKVCDGAITSAKIALSAVDAMRLAPGAVTTSTVDNGAITTSKLADAAVTVAKINSGGAINGSVLTVAAVGVTWAAPVGLNLPFVANVSTPQVAFDIQQGIGTALRGTSAGPDAVAVYGEATDPASGSIATGVVGKSSGGNGRGVFGEATVTDGPEPSYGVYGLAHSRKDGSAGIFGRSPNTDGIVHGVMGVTETVDGGAGVRGAATPAGGVGSSFGVYGTSTSTTNLSAAVYGESTATSGSTRGVWGKVNSPSGAAYAMYAEGKLAATGTKSFLQPHPTDPALQIRFVCLEGNEAGTYFRGSARLAGGRAIIEVPEEFRLCTEVDGITVQVTAVGQRADLWVEAKDLRRIVVRGQPDAPFDYLVNGVRRGYARHTAIEPNTAYVPAESGVPFGAQYPLEIRALLVASGVLNADFTPNEATATRLGWKLKGTGEPLGDGGLQ